MTRRLIQLVLLLVGNAVGLIVANLLFDDMALNGTGFFIALALFTVAEIILTPIVGKSAEKWVPAAESAVALVTTFLALLVTDVVSDGLDIEGAGTWIGAAVVVWLITLIAGAVLPAIFLRDEPATR